MKYTIKHNGSKWVINAYGQSSMSISKDGAEIMHTANRALKGLTKENLKEYLMNFIEGWEERVTE